MRERIGYSTFDDRSHARNLRLERCWFDVASFGQRWAPQDPPWSVRDVDVIDCANKVSCQLFGGVFDEVVVDGLEGATVWLSGCVFRHVVIRGKCSSIVIRRQVSPGPRRVTAVDLVEAETYATIDWALDVSELAARDVELLGVPARLVRRDPGTQLVATLERVRATQAVWRHPAFQDDPWPTMLDRMLALEVADQVLVTPTRRRSSARDVEVLRTLQREGVLEPD